MDIASYNATKEEHSFIYIFLSLTDNDNKMIMMMTFLKGSKVYWAEPKEKEKKFISKGKGKTFLKLLSKIPITWLNKVIISFIIIIIMDFFCSYFTATARLLLQVQLFLHQAKSFPLQQEKEC